MSNKSIFLGFKFHLVCTDTHEITPEMVIGLMQSHSFLSRNLIFFFHSVFYSDSLYNLAWNIESYPFSVCLEKWDDRLDVDFGVEETTDNAATAATKTSGVSKAANKKENAIEMRKKPTN